MPATESTWRNQQLLHRIFAVSGLALLGATMWMLYADHDREWKRYQDTARHIDLQYNDWYELQYETNEAVRKHEELAAAYTLAQAGPVDAELLAKFEAEAQDVSESARDVQAAGLGELKKAHEQALEDCGSDLSKAEAKPLAKAIAARQKIVDALNDIVYQAKFRETNALNARKFKSADLDAIKAKLDIAIHNSLPAAEREPIAAEVARITGELDALKLAWQAASSHRTRLQEIARGIASPEQAAKVALEANQADLRKLQTTHAERQLTYFSSRVPFLGKKWLTLPIIDAFNSPRKIENLWSNDLTIDYNFSRVRRFDRCTTCHQAMEKTQPGTADQPLFNSQTTIRLALATPSKQQIDDARKEIEAARAEAISKGQQPTVEFDAEVLLKVYGLRLGSAGLVHEDDVTVSYVAAGSLGATAELAASDEQTSKLDGAVLRRGIIATTTASQAERPTAGLALGDVIAKVNGNIVDRPEEVVRQLVRTLEHGKPIELEIRRGFEHPYASHPRLDLFVGSTSPHKMQTFACTVCHEGQGSATQFKWASHTPDDVRQQERWSKEHGWFDNAHWIYPMYPSRFAESACLKCHHEVTELEPSDRFPDAPAPKVTHGYHLVRKYGCYGCHEIKGFDGPTRRVGPDMRLESNYFAAAQQLKAVLAATKSTSKLSSDESRWIEQLINNPELSEPRHRLYTALTSDQKASESRLPAEAHALAGLLKDEEAPGSLRRPGPSLRYVSSKLDDQFLYDWIREPKNFRPTSRMPQFFGMWDHLSGKSKATAEKYEGVEILGMIAYLKARSQQHDLLPFEKTQEPPAETDDARQQARVERGKIAFQERGCLACHTHGDFPDVSDYRSTKDIVQGPDLTGLGSKFAAERNPKGRQWLYSWIKQPTRYHARTVMPDLYLNPVVKKDDKGAVVSVTDPAADITDYLLSSSSEKWQAPKDISAAAASLDSLVLENLQEAFFEEAAQQYLKTGIPAKLAASLKGAERELLVSDEDFAAGKVLSDERKLVYLGGKSIAKYGCFGCHDVPGFEDAKPIGTGLADWGRKDPAKLAFEHVTHYLHGHGHDSGETGEHADGGHNHDAKDAHGAHDHASHGERPELPPFYAKHIEAGHREGFLWQKLAEPRSYDFMKTENKRYNERLRMPKFPFNAEEREAVITFVLGLVADPPATKYLYRPDSRQTALIKGKQVLDKFNCAGCHVMQAEQWTVSYKSGEAAAQSEVKAYPYLASHFTPEQVKASQQADAAGRVRATLIGMPSLVDADARPMVNDADGDPLEEGAAYDPTKVVYPFELWQPALIDGNKYEPGVMALQIPSSRIEKRRPAQGGVLARYLLPHVTQREKQVNPAAKGTESWAWVPPPLLNEGIKVQSAWLHDFLLNPYPIRPAVVLRMPRFNMSSEESAALVEYFSAVDDSEYPYASTERRQPSYLAEKQQAYEQKQPKPADGGKARERLQDGLKIITNNNYCVKCHLVGDFEPTGSDRAKGPNLARVYERFRPQYLRDWIANPKKFLPYSAMPINIPFDPDDKEWQGGISRDLYHGTSVEQVESLVDLLMNYDNFAKRQTLIAPLVQPAPTTAPAATSEGQSKEASGGAQ